MVASLPAEAAPNIEASARALRRKSCSTKRGNAAAGAITPPALR